MDKLRKIVYGLVLVLLMGILVPIYADAVSAQPSGNPPYKIVVVKRGDCLWNIAKKECPNRNVREVVDEMYKLNEIGKYIYPGQQLKVPIDNPRPVRSSTAASRGLIGREMVCVATAYTHTGNRTATMTWPQERRTIAVDPSVIPLRSKVYVTCDSWPNINGIYIAEDTGGLIKGYRIDLFMNSRDQAILWGRRTVKVRILE
ncbi:MAG: 3D domain-containing protein [Syntrophomonadales bacterium]|jgi:3D (Asp-Asp-Asp) domain-containing protein